MNKQRVVVAMSGGVDSSVAAALLSQRGYEVIGITMCFNLAPRQSKKPACCGLEGIEDARAVAAKLGIRHYVLNMGREFKKYVVDDFCRQYSLGRTPNPCILCNQHIKFDALLKHALSLRARYLATGHYAQIACRAGKYFLKKAKDKSKDQSYFLYRLGSTQLKRLLFPLGDYTKKEVRVLANKFGLPTAQKKESQEICFAPQDYPVFLRQHLADIRPGEIVDKLGNVLGRHKGIVCYTYGQRQGLGVAKGYPLYISEINAADNRLTVGPRGEAMKKTFLLKSPHFVKGLPKKKVAVLAKIRYNHKESLAYIKPFAKLFKVTFNRPQFAITPGQSAVFYDRDIVLGGGIIDKVL
ncbi:MAG: tRNA 2-thiouridine(34) synthase MnmA [Candidatus Omnitrophota bacterium]|nr:tRNA 2-thiouridine(34) synthase MnmA [Candidatus Omnitrophota bacterium]